MGWRLAEEAQDYAPESLTPREMYVLCVLANSARDDTRRLPDGATERPEIVRRMRVNRRERYRVLEALVAKDALVVVRSGRAAGRSPVYAIAPFALCITSQPSVEKPHSLSGENRHSDSQPSVEKPHSLSGENRHSDARRLISVPSVSPVISLSALLDARAPSLAGAERERFIDYVRTQLRPRHLPTYLRSWSDEDWSWHLAAARGGQGAAASSPPRPDWCGYCSEQSRFAEDEQGRPYPCPDCHPSKGPTNALDVRLG